MRFYTWVDVDDFIKRKYREEALLSKVCNIQTFSDGIEIVVKVKDNIESAKDILASWFIDWYDREKNLIYLESLPDKPRSIPIFFSVNSNSLSQQRLEFKPQFGDVALFPDNAVGVTCPKEIEKTPSVVAFYSFKGGVGRTVHLVGALKALLERKDHDYSLKILVVDADLEAPGLTWWVKENGQQADYSFLDLLAMANYDNSDELDDTLEIAKRHLLEMPLTIEKNKVYFLPAFRNTHQLLRFPIRPENLINHPDRAWVVGDLMFKLGQKLDVDFVLIDLRAGLSELTAPVLFDPRIYRLLVTTCANQSLEGTKLVLRELAKFASCFRAQDLFMHPTLIVSMVTEDLKGNPRYQDAQVELVSSYSKRVDEKEDDETGSPLLVSTDFAPTIVNIGTLSQLWSALSGTQIYNKMAELFNLIVPTPKTEIFSIDISKRLGTLEAEAIKIEYAESGEGQDYLRIPAIVNLAQRFSRRTPTAVVIGSKGAGKTYLYLQLARLETWNRFLLDINIDIAENATNVELFPFIESVTLNDKAKDITEIRRQTVINMLGGTGNYRIRQVFDEVNLRLRDTSWVESEWRDFWVDQIGKVLGLPMAGPAITLDDIQLHLRLHQRKIVILIDGLEDILPEVKTDERQAKALRGLLQIPEVLRELRESNLGCICFIRQDLLRAVIKQNLGQYEFLYRPFELKWDFTEALRLFYWFYRKTDASPDELYPSYSKDDLIEKLIPLWGAKLGPNNSREAFVANWVLAALSDFQGQLQARDIVRFIRFSAAESQRLVAYKDRLLQPNGIRKAIEACSREKVKEFKQEFSSMDSTFAKLESHPVTERKIPFDSKTYGLSAEEIEQLITLGVIQRIDEKYYMPEIFRHGLSFALERGARPIVLAWMRTYL